MLIVFGSINLDIAVPVGRMPLAGETLLGGDALVSPGGKGANQAHAAQRYGVATRLFGCVGADPFAQAALACLRRAGVDVGGVAAVAQATGLALITVAPDGDNAIVVAPGANALAQANQVSDADLEAARVLLLQWETPLEQAGALARRARALGCKVILNASPLPADGELPLDGIDILIVNQIELRQLAQRVGSGADAAALAKVLGAQVLLTLGADGSLLAAPGGGLCRVPALPVEVRDTTGAGDTFAGVFAAALAEGAQAPEAMRAATVAAGLACTRAGAQLAQPLRAELAAHLNIITLEEGSDTQ